MFWHSNFLRYGHFVEYMNMHAVNMWLTDAATVVVGADWTLHPWRHNNVGSVTAGQARHNSSNGGGSLRARLDTTLVYFSPLGDRATLCHQSTPRHQTCVMMKTCGMTCRVRHSERWSAIFDCLVFDRCLVV